MEHIQNTNNTDNPQMVSDTEMPGLSRVRSAHALLRPSLQMINALPLISITKAHVKAEECCSICIEDFVYEEAAKKLPCKVSSDLQI